MSKKPKGCITVEEAKKLERNYVEKIEKTLEKDLGCQECREFWWSLEELDEYIHYVKKEAEEKGYKNLGLRFYLGKYDKDQNKHEDVTMFIAPTGINTKEPLAPIKGQVVGAKSVDVDNNIYGVAAFNGGHSRKPPKDY